MGVCLSFVSLSFIRTSFAPSHPLSFTPPSLFLSLSLSLFLNLSLGLTLTPLSLIPLDKCNVSVCVFFLPPPCLLGGFLFFLCFQCGNCVSECDRGVIVW